ncbi:unnamed protein product, partial [Symbiodinium sp. KB8]
YSFCRILAATAHIFIAKVQLWSHLHCSYGDDVDGLPVKESGMASDLGWFELDGHMDMCPNNRRRWADVRDEDEEAFKKQYLATQCALMLKTPAGMIKIDEAPHQAFDGGDCLWAHLVPFTADAHVPHHRGLEDASDDIPETQVGQSPKWTAAGAPTQEGTALRFANNA